jgi:hypothetical protein
MNSAQFLRFGGNEVANKDVYNPTAPFLDRGITYLAARVESRAIETDSHVLFFVERDEVYYCDPITPIFPLQDPFVTRIDKELIFGGVSFPVNENSWQTYFYRGPDLLNLDKFAEGPVGMKDIRLVELHDGSVGVFTRPMGPIGGRGKIGFTIIDSLERLNDLDWYGANLIEGQFSGDEWGGVNEAHLLGEGSIGVVGHFAYFTFNDAKNLRKHYKSIIFNYDYFKMQASPMKVLTTRFDFPAGEAKRSPELDDIVISGGIYGLKNEKVKLYVGLSDVNCGLIEIDNPFKRYLQ